MSSLSTIYQIFMRILWAVYQLFIKFLWGLYEQFINHLSLRKFSSTKKLSIGLFSNAIKLEGISSLTYKRIAPPFQSRSNLYDVLKPSIKNWLWRKVPSIFVSEIISISILPLIWSLSNSNLFLMEFLFKWANINLLTLSLRLDFRVLSEF